jgi:hypothetical protein
MAKWYAGDLRSKVLRAYDRGEGTLEQLAERFSVSVPWAWKISAQRKRSRQMERMEQRRGGRRKITAEVQARLRGGKCCNRGVCGFKSHSTPANGTRKPISSGASLPGNARRDRTGATGLSR